MQKLFEEFKPISAEQWKAQIVADLKGADYDKSLVWNTLEGFKVQPYYRNEDLKQWPVSQLKPNQFPYLRGHKSNKNQWLVRQTFELKKDLDGHAAIDACNASILDGLMRGVDSVNIKIDSQAIQSQAEFDRLLRGIQLTAIELNIENKGANADLISMLVNFLQHQKIDKQLVTGSFNIDPLAWITTEGFCEHNTIEQAYGRLTELILFAKEHLPKFQILSINTRIFSNAGASSVQEIGYGLAMAQNYISELSVKVPIDILLQSIRFNIGVSSNYFMEIAKVRALRYLWSKLGEAWGAQAESTQVWIHAENSLWNKTIFDPYVNMLRVTTESMSAVIGGVDSLTVLPYDAIYRATNEQSERAARNTQIILKEEAYFDKVADPAGGSYYIENLSQSIIEHAWKLLLKVDDMGGYFKSLEQGLVQSDIHELAQQRDMNIATRKEIFLGTNQYPNAAEQMNTQIDKRANVSEKPANKIQTLRQYRGAEAFENIRIEVEQHAKTPKVLMLTFGSPTMRRARSQFASNFFACAAYQIFDHNGFKTVAEGVQYAKEINADIVVMCSEDDAYPEMVQSLSSEQKSEFIWVIAGYPKDQIEMLQLSGIEHFIHIKSNVLAQLSQFNRLILK